MEQFGIFKCFGSILNCSHFFDEKVRVLCHPSKSERPSAPHGRFPKGAGLPLYAHAGGTGQADFPEQHPLQDESGRCCC